MAGSPGHAHEVLRRAAAARADGNGDGARVAYLRAFELGRGAGDIPTMTEAALGLAAGQQFGIDPGRVPAFLHEAYVRADGVQRIRLATALARAWAYGGHPERAGRFAAEAVAGAGAAENAELLAEALDAQLLVLWGPDDLTRRLSVTGQLEETVAHLTDVGPRLTAVLWRLTTALETLDSVAVNRQLRALDVLAADSGSPRVEFFALSRRGMHALLVGDVAAARALAAAAVRAGAAAGEPDSLAIERTMAAGIARQTGDLDALAREARSFETFGTNEGVSSIAAEAASLWLAAGSMDRARALLEQVAGAGLDRVPRDVDWLLTVGTLTEVAAGTGARERAAEGVRLLQPFAGRGVVNAGAVAFVGVVDDHLSRAYAALGEPDQARRWAAGAASCYQRIGAAWWLRRLQLPAVPSLLTVHLYPHADGLWLVGRDGQVVAVRDARGLHYLRLLLRRPGVELTATDLSDRVSGHAGTGVVQPGIGPVIDRPALMAYRTRIEEIDSELDEADSWVDSVRATRLRSERDALLDQVAAASGLHGRVRDGTSTAERARVAVRKALVAALGRIAGHDPVLGRLLHDTIRTGAYCRYDPDPARPVIWVLDPPSDRHPV